MERISKYGALGVMIFGFCFLQGGIFSHLNSGSAEITAPNNYFIGIGALIFGMGIVMAIISIKIAKSAKTDQLPF